MHSHFIIYRFILIDNFTIYIAMLNTITQFIVYDIFSVCLSERIFAMKISLHSCQQTMLSSVELLIMYHGFNKHDS